VCPTYTLPHHVLDVWQAALWRADSLQDGLFAHCQLVFHLEQAIRADVILHLLALYANLALLRRFSEYRASLGVDSVELLRVTFIDVVCDFIVIAHVVGTDAPDRFAFDVV